ncbi:hypothetical protein P10159_0710 [Citrobacter portucalensis]|nr:hypothetical protein P10159_0710 [Citrobacter portucalensis]
MPPVENEELRQKLAQQNALIITYCVRRWDQCLMPNESANCFAN